MDPMALLVPIQDNVLVRITLKDNNVIIVRISFSVFLPVNHVNAIRVDQMDWIAMPKEFAFVTKT